MKSSNKNKSKKRSVFHEHKKKVIRIFRYFYVSVKHVI